MATPGCPAPDAMGKCLADVGDELLQGLASKCGWAYGSMVQRGPNCKGINM